MLACPAIYEFTTHRPDVMLSARSCIVVARPSIEISPCFDSSTRLFHYVFTVPNAMLNSKTPVAVVVKVIAIGVGGRGFDYRAD